MIGAQVPSDRQNTTCRYRCTGCGTTKIGSRASISFPPGSVRFGRRAFASHEVEWRTRIMGTIKNIRQSKMHAQRGRCYYCSLPMWDPALDFELPKICRTRAMQKKLRCTAEHLLPRSEGGVDAAKNIVAACWYCNTRRHHTKHPLSPDAHRAHVQKRMAAGRWLAAQLPHNVRQLWSEMVSATLIPY